MFTLSGALGLVGDGMAERSRRRWNSIRVMRGDFWAHKVLKPLVTKSIAETGVTSAGVIACSRFRVGGLKLHNEEAVNAL